MKIEVRLFYADMFEGQRAAQKQLVVDELVKRDVVCAAKAVASKCPAGTYFKQLRQGETIVAAGCVK